MRKKIVLLVDENDNSRRTLRTLLEIYGCEVIEAADGWVAARLARKQHPHLVMMAIKLAGLDGLEDIRRTRSSDETRHVTIVVLSSFSNDMGWKRRAIESGADQCLMRPKDDEELKTVVHNYLMETGALVQPFA